MNKLPGMQEGGVEEYDKETTRVEAFSDGVYAIAITLLALNMKVPLHDVAEQNGGLLTLLANQWPDYMAFLVSFLLILVMWINHHRLFTAIRRTDDNLLLINGFLLLTITIVPFPTRLLSEYLGHADQQTAVAVYDAWVFVIAIASNLLWRYAAHHKQLLSTRTDHKLMANILRLYARGPVIYLIAFGLSFINSLAGLAINVAVVIFFAVSNKRLQTLISEQVSPP